MKKGSRVSKAKGKSVTNPARSAVSKAAPAAAPPRDERADAVLAEISTGATVQRACDKHGFRVPTFYALVRDDANFRNDYARAKDLQHACWADEVIDISDDGRNDTYLDDSGNRRADAEWISRSKLRVDSRRWLLSKLKPGTYGDKVTAELSGPNGGPIQTQSRIDLSLLTDEQLAQFEALALAAARATEEVG